MKKILIICFLVLFPVATFAGYGNTLWGMTPNEVLSSEGEKVKIIDPIKYHGDNFGKVQSKNVIIDSAEYTVTYIFNANDKLEQVNVISDDKNNIKITNLRFDSLRNLLTQKYGDAVFLSSDKAVWKTDDTTIELIKTNIPKVLSQTSVRYIPNAKISSDASSL